MTVVGELPSGEDALAALRGERAAWGRVVRDVGVRAVLISLGLRMAGDKTKLAAKSVAASLVIEVFVFGWQARSLKR